MALHGRRSKFNAIPTEVDGITFHSQKEAHRYSELKLLLKAGVIAKLELQPRFDLVVNDIPITTYVADFRYYDRERKETVVEDVKGMRTREFRIKARLLKALKGIVVLET
jgi:hypothetical protein